MYDFFRDKVTKDCPFVTEAMIEKLYTMHTMLVKYNDEFDLSRIKNEREMVIKHFVDSLIILKYIKLPESLVDIGTGAGFPGLPLAICNPQTHFILAEPKGRRVDFMEMVKTATGISNIEIYPHKVNEKTNFEVGGVITRAFETVETTMNRARFLPPQGLLIFLKGPGADEDLAELSQENREAFRQRNDIHYFLPGTPYERRLLVFEKTSQKLSKSFLLSENPYMTAGLNITSAENKHFKALKKVVAPGGLKKSGMTMVCGKKQICDVHRLYSDSVKYLVLPEAHVENDARVLEIISKEEQSQRLLLLQKSLYRELDVLETGGPLLFIGLPEIFALETFTEWNASLICMTPFQDPQNLGSVVRSAAAFGVHNIVITESTVNPYHPRAIRASSAAVFLCKFFKTKDIDSGLDFLEAGGYQIVALDKSGSPIDGISPAGPLCLLSGIEGAGLPEKLKSKSWSIPISDQVESLNTAVSASIGLYEIIKKIKHADH